MAFPPLLLGAGLIFAVSATPALPVSADSVNGTRLPVDYRLPSNNVAPIHYDVRLTPYIEEGNFTFDGEVDVSVEIGRPTRNLSLHALNLTIDETATSLLDGDGVAHAPATHRYNNLTAILTLDFDRQLPAGIYLLSVRFVGVLHDDFRGFFRESYVNEEGDTVWLAATQFETTWARRAFPCWDEPALKATFNVSIRHHRSYTVVSNMPIREQTWDGDAASGAAHFWTHFHTTPIMSTYLVAFVVSYCVRVPNADGTVNTWSRSEVAPYSKFAQDVAEKAGSLLTWYTNITDSIPKMDHLTIPKLLAGTGAMENWGLIIYSEEDFLYNEELHMTNQKLTVARTVAHEMAHQWFGNAVSPSWWSQMWLNEGFAAFFEIYVVDQIFKDWRVMESFVTDMQMYALDMDINANVMPIVSEVSDPKEISSLFTIITYRKGPAILRMLEHIITGEVFRDGLIRYLKKHQFSSATTDDLWNALQAALDDSDVPHSDYRLKEAMDTWITQKHFPVVHVTRDYDTGETILTQEHFRAFDDGESVYENKWWIPVTFATQTSPDFNDTVPVRWLNPHQNVTIDGIEPADWIIVNLQATGYYRVNYDIRNWRRIASYLKSDNYTNVHVLNRAQIIDDAYHLVAADQLDVMTFLDLVSYLSREMNLIAWTPLLNILAYIEDFCRYPENAFVKPQMLEILSKFVETVGYEEDPNEDDFTKLKRIDVLKWACTFGHPECKMMATIKLNRHLADPETNKISPDLKRWTFCNGMMQANASTWNKLLGVYMEKKRDDTLHYLTCSEDPDIIINYLNMFLSNDTLMLDRNQYDSVLYFILDKHADNEPVFDYLLENVDKIISGHFSITEAFAIIINSVHSNGKLDKISELARTDFNEKYEEKIKDMIDKRKFRLSDKLTAFRPFILERR